jgi:pre-mRNA-processing factor 17
MAADLCGVVTSRLGWAKTSTMSLVHEYSSDEEDAAVSSTSNIFGTMSNPIVKKIRVGELTGIIPNAAPDVLTEVRGWSSISRLEHTDTSIQDPLNQTSLITRPTDTQMNVNIPYSDMMLPLQGPENPFGDRNRFLNQNALAGHVEEQAMTEHAFRSQHLTHSILGYSANPSIDPNAPSILGSVESAQANGFATINTIGAPRTQKKELKRKRHQKGDVEVVDGEGSYAGPWASWDGEEPQNNFLEGVDMGEDEDVEEEPEPEIPKRKPKAKGGAFGQEHSVFHGKSMTDYQGRTYMAPPLAEAPHLTSEAGSQECFIPKVCIHTWTGHTQGVSVVRLFPDTGHLLLSGSMDTKIKVGSAPPRLCPLLIKWVPALGRVHAWKLPSYVPWPYKSCKRRDIFQ